MIIEAVPQPIQQEIIASNVQSNYDDEGNNYIHVFNITNYNTTNIQLNLTLDTQAEQFGIDEYVRLFYIQNDEMYNPTNLDTVGTIHEYLANEREYIFQFLLDDTSQYRMNYNINFNNSEANYTWLCIFTEFEGTGYDSLYNVNIQVNNINNFYTQEQYTANYQNGYNHGVANGNQEAYNNGYNQGLITGNTNGYNNGYEEGYEIGYNKGASIPTNTAYSEGYTKGLIEGSNSKTTSEYNNLMDLLIGVVELPFVAFKNIWNLSPLGVNISIFVLGIFTLLIVIYIWKKIR